MGVLFVNPGAEHNYNANESDTTMYLREQRNCKDLKFYVFISFKILLKIGIEVSVKCLLLSRHCGRSSNPCTTFWYYQKTKTFTQMSNVRNWFVL